MESENEIAPPSSTTTRPDKLNKVKLTPAEIAARLEDEIKFEVGLQDLNLLASRIKEDPNGFQEEIIKMIKKFNTAFHEFKRNPVKKSMDLAMYSVFIANIFEFYSEDLKFIIGSISQLLESYSGLMHYFNRKKALSTLIIISKKGFWKPFESVKFFSNILLLEDRDLRKQAADHIFAVIKKHDHQGKSSLIHRELTDFFQECISEGKDELAKRMVRIIALLYRRMIWKDKKSMNIIANAALHNYHKVA